MNVCQNPNCRGPLNQGISIFYNGHSRILCSWNCVQEFSHQAEANERFWPPPILARQEPTTR